MKLLNVRHAPIRVAGVKLRRGSSMDITPDQISDKLQKLITKGHFIVLATPAKIEVVNRVEPDEDLPETQPASPIPPEPTPVPPPVPPVEEEAKPQEKVEEPSSSIDTKEEKPKITRRRRKKSVSKSKE